MRLLCGSYYLKSALNSILASLALGLPGPSSSASPSSPSPRQDHQAEAAGRLCPAGRCPCGGECGHESPRDEGGAASVWRGCVRPPQAAQGPRTPSPAPALPAALGMPLLHAESSSPALTPSVFPPKKMALPCAPSALTLPLNWCLKGDSNSLRAPPPEPVRPAPTLPGRADMEGEAPRSPRPAPAVTLAACSML